MMSFSAGGGRVNGLQLKDPYQRKDHRKKHQKIKHSNASLVCFFFLQKKKEVVCLKETKK